jgi:choline dehydrogenase-like flavoprotein
MGLDSRTSPLDPSGLFRGLENLHVTDASSFPSSAGVNPSLTISANALRVGALVSAALGHSEPLEIESVA